MGQNRAYSGSFKATYDLVIAFHFHSAESNPICRQSRQQGLRTVLELPQHCRQRIRTNIRLNGIGLKEKVQVQKVSVSRNNIIHFFITYTFFANHFFLFFLWHDISRVGLFLSAKDIRLVQGVQAGIQDTYGYSFRPQLLSQRSKIYAVHDNIKGGKIGQRMELCILQNRQGGRQTNIVSLQKTHIMYFKK